MSSNFTYINPYVGNQLPESLDIPEDIKDQKEVQQYLYKRISSTVNTKEGALYAPEEVSTFQRFFTKNNPQIFRNTYRKLFDMVDLNAGVNIPAGGTVSFPHNLGSLTTPTRIYGTATSVTPTYLPLPYASATANKNIEIWFDAVNVNLINGAGQPALSQAYIIIEFTKN